MIHAQLVYQLIHVQLVLLDFRQGYLFLFVGCLSLSHDVYPFCRMFIPLLLISLLLMAYLPKSLLRVYIRVRKYDLVVLVSPIVMIEIGRASCRERV